MQIACKSPSWRQYRYVSLWLCLNLRFTLPQTNFVYDYGERWFQINKSDSDESPFMNELATQFYVPDDVPRAHRPFGTGCVKLQLPFLTRDAGPQVGKETTLLYLVDILNVLVSYIRFMQSCLVMLESRLTTAGRGLRQQHRRDLLSGGDLTRTQLRWTANKSGVVDVIPSQS